MSNYDSDPCWFCDQDFYVEEDDNRMVEVFFEDESGLIKHMEVALCTPCGSRLLASFEHPQAKRGPSIIFKLEGIE